MESRVYTGKVWHRRFMPTQHSFDYRIYLFWLHLNQLPEVEASVPKFSHNKRNWIELRDTDYLAASAEPIEHKARQKMQFLAEQDMDGDIFLLGQPRMLGLYFSPVNFYFHRSREGIFTHMLAEVSNTPWHERHCYLVDMTDQKDTAKSFHVSPFNPMDMDYSWKIAIPDDKFNMTLDCIKGEKHFGAGLVLKQQPLTPKNINQLLWQAPSMTAKTVLGIYWQALKLFIKGTPIYDHPNRGTQPR